MILPIFRNENSGKGFYKFWGKETKKGISIYSYIYIYYIRMDYKPLKSLILKQSPPMSRSHKFWIRSKSIWLISPSGIQIFSFGHMIKMAWTTTPSEYELFLFENSWAVINDLWSFWQVSKTYIQLYVGADNKLCKKMIINKKKSRDLHAQAGVFYGWNSTKHCTVCKRGSLRIWPSIHKWSVYVLGKSAKLR